MSISTNNKIYIGSLILLALIFILSYRKYSNLESAKLYGERVKVVINELSCKTGKNNSFYVFKRNGEIHLVRINYDDCQNYQVGDSALTYYNNETDIYYSPKEDGSDEKWGMISTALLFLLVVLFLIFPKLFKFPW
jgi:hypothetical protein